MQQISKRNLNKTNNRKIYRSGNASLPAAAGKETKSEGSLENTTPYKLLQAV